MNLYSFDLNLLTVFHTIYCEQHLTKAGERLRLTQPAMSNALTRLREMLDDPLFVRSGKQMLPTPRAKEIAPIVEEMLKHAEKALIVQEPFNPKTSEKTFRLAMSDYTELVVFPLLFKWLTAEAPKIKIESIHLPPKNQQEILRSQEVDLMIGENLSEGANVYRQVLFYDREVCMVRQGHPLTKGEFTIEKYLDISFAQFKISEQYETQADKQLKSLGQSRKVVLKAHHELILPVVLLNTDMAVNLPERMAQFYQQFMPLEYRPIPLELAAFDIKQYWFERDHHDPAHQWFRNGVKALFDDTP